MNGNGAGANQGQPGQGQPAVSSQAQSAGPASHPTRPQGGAGPQQRQLPPDPRGQGQMSQQVFLDVIDQCDVSGYMS